MPVLTCQPVPQLLDQQRPGFNLISQKAVHHPQFIGVIRGDIEVFQHGQTDTGSGAKRESRKRAKPNLSQPLLACPTCNGRHGFRGIRQSIPSGNIDNCAAVTLILPSFAADHTNRPFSRRLLNRHAPVDPTK